MSRDLSAIFVASLSVTLASRRSVFSSIGGTLRGSCGSARRPRSDIFRRSLLNARMAAASRWRHRAVSASCTVQWRVTCDVNEGRPPPWGLLDHVPIPDGPKLGDSRFAVAHEKGKELPVASLLTHVGGNLEEKL
jgi:hypothetical protein